MTAQDMVASEIVAAYAKARMKHVRMRSPHEGYAIILEEFEELWDEIKAWQPMPQGYLDYASEFGRGASIPQAHLEYGSNMQNMRKEALHLAAMSLAFLLEVTPL